MQKENMTINFLKGIACILVILSHYHGSGVVGDIVYSISHFGVPVFFLISGYFLYNGSNTVKKLPPKISHIFKLIFLYIGIYVLNFILERIILWGNVIRKDIVVNDILLHFTIRSLKTTLFWSSSLFGVGQWFLNALFEGYIVFWIIYKVHIEKFFEKYGIGIATTLFHIPIRIALIKAGISDIFGINISDSLFVRNVWFDAIPFMLVGLWLRINQERIQIFSKKHILPFIAIHCHWRNGSKHRRVFPYGSNIKWNFNEFGTVFRNDCIRYKCFYLGDSTSRRSYRKGRQRN